MLLWKSKSRVLQEEVDFLRAQVAQLQNYILMVSPTALTQQQQPTLSFPTEVDEVRRMYSTETEEDLEFMLQEGLISPDEYARKLEQETNDALYE